LFSNDRLPCLPREMLLVSDIISVESFNVFHWGALVTIFFTLYFDWSFLSFVSPGVFPEAERELEIRTFAPLGSLDTGFVWKEQIVEPVGDGIVEERWHPKEAF
jgi:hypothetical protein